MCCWLSIFGLSLGDGSWTVVPAETGKGIQAARLSPPLAVSADPAGSRHLCANLFDVQSLNAQMAVSAARDRMTPAALMEAASISAQMAARSYQEKPLRVLTHPAFRVPTYPTFRVLTHPA